MLTFVSNIFRVKKLKHGSGQYVIGYMKGTLLRMFSWEFSENFPTTIFPSICTELLLKGYIVQKQVNWLL